MSNLLDRLDTEQRNWLRLCGELAGVRRGRAFLVGGSVRDLILNRDQADLDVVVEGDGMGVAEDLARSLGADLTRHHAFQTCVVKTPAGLRFDVATARCEEYRRPGELPRVVAGSLEEDLGRRDFTINAMAISLSDLEFGAFYDLHNGQTDLETGCIRVMHPRSFADDPTRVLRALRFSLRYGYMIESETEQWLKEAITGGYLDTVSGERICKELRLTFEESPIQGPLRFDAEGALTRVHIGLRARKEILQELQDLVSWERDAGGVVSKIDEPIGWTMVLGCCATDLPAQERWNVARQLRLSREERAPLIDSGVPWRKAVNHLFAGPSPPPDSAVERAFREVDRGALLIAAATVGADAAEAKLVRSYLANLRGVEPELGGSELKELGISEGPQLGEFLERLRSAKLDGNAPNIAAERRLVAIWLAENWL